MLGSLVDILAREHTLSAMSWRHSLTVLYTVMVHCPAGARTVCQQFITCVNFSEETLFKMLYSCFRCCGCEPSAVFVIDVWKLLTLCSSCSVSLPPWEVPADCADSEVMAITSFLDWVLLPKTTEKYHPPPFMSLISSFVSLFRLFTTYFLFVFREGTLQSWL